MNHDRIPERNRKIIEAFKAGKPCCEIAYEFNLTLKYTQALVQKARNSIRRTYEIKTKTGVTTVEAKCLNAALASHFGVKNERELRAMMRDECKTWCIINEDGKEKVRFGI